MSWMRVLFRRCASLARARRLDRELDEELRAHIDLAIEDYQARGMSAEEARITALRSFGGVTQVRETYRLQRGLPLLDELARDMRFAFRSLRKSPGFTCTAILTLALGIGAVTSVFSVVNGILLKPFAFRDPERLVVLREAVYDPVLGDRTATPDNYRHVMRLKKTATTIEDVAIFAQQGLSVSVSGEHPSIVGTVLASPNLFRILGVQPMLGRGLMESDAKRRANRVVVLSNEGWHMFFGGDPKAIGQTLRVDGQPVSIVGVLPPGMRFPQIKLAPKTAFQETARDALLYEAMTPSDRDLNADMGNFNYKAIARLKPGVTLERASAELESLQRAYTLSARLPLHFGISLTPLTKDVSSGISGALWLLFAAVGAVLLIACVNLASLQLARAVNAERETAVCAALGASKLQLVRSRLTESLLLAIIGGAAGVALSFAGVRVLLQLVPANVPRLEEVRVSMPVLLFATGLSIMAAITFGILPALRSLRIQPNSALQGSSVRVANKRDGTRTRNIMVGAQVACTVLLLVVTSLVLRSFSHLLHQNRGFDTSHITLAQVDLFTPQYDKGGPLGNAIRISFIDRAMAALHELPGVQSTAITSVTPLTGETWVDTLSRPDHPVGRGKEPPINVRWIDPDYLPTLHTPLVAGRNFTAADRANPYVALISEKTARQGFPGEDPIGHKIADLVPDDKHALTVIGIVADGRINGLKDDAAMVYVPYWAFPPFTLSFLVRSSQPSRALAPEMRRAIWQIDPQVAIPVLKSMDDQVNESVATDRFQAVVLTSFGTAALLLALLGIYGVLVYSVSLRRQEFGIRIALGSDRAALVRLVLYQAAHPVLIGTCAGLVTAGLVVRWVHSLLFEVPTIDPVAIGGSVMLLLAAAAVAAIVPARRAASIDPMQALRIE